jgi:L-rhamnose-H+ transport protein
MQTTELYGLLIATLSGLIMGVSPWPLKFMRRYRYEHFGLVSMLFALVVLPWSIAIVTCPNFLIAVTELPPGVLLKANAFTVGWGIAQVLALQCFVRIGVSLTYSILCGVGAGVGVVTPMVLRASGQFADSPSLFSSAGLMVLAGLAVLVIGIFFASLAGFSREKAFKQAADQAETPSDGGGSFAVGLVMVVTAGILSAGWGLAFAYGQGPIIAVMKAHGAADISASIAVWALALSGAAAVNVLYPLWLLRKNRNWDVFQSHPAEFCLALAYGALFFLPSVLLGQGMLQLGVLGASVGFGVVQGTLIIGGQLLGFLSGEWRGAPDRSRHYIYIAILVLILSVVLLASANAIRNTTPNIIGSRLAFPSMRR